MHRSGTVELQSCVRVTQLCQLSQTMLPDASRWDLTSRVIVNAVVTTKSPQSTSSPLTGTTMVLVRTRELSSGPELKAVSALAGSIRCCSLMLLPPHATTAKTHATASTGLTMNSSVPNWF